MRGRWKMTLGKKFIFGCWAIFCVSMTSIILKYTGDVYIKLIGFITGLFLAGQTIVDSIKKKEVV